MDSTHFGKDQVDANKYFQMKYFLRQDEKLAAVKQKVHEINLARSRRGDDAPTPKSNT